MNGSDENISMLATLTTEDLFKECDHYGIDAPLDLDRNFVIVELAEAMQEQKAEDDIEGEDSELETEDIEEDEECEDNLDELENSCNETRLGLVMRNPVWAYVFWDISSTDMYKLEVMEQSYTLKLRVELYPREAVKGFSSGKVNSTLKLLDIQHSLMVDSYEIQVGKDNREQFLLLPSGEHYFVLSLIVETIDEREDMDDSGFTSFRRQLGESIGFYMPCGSRLLTREKFSFNMGFSPIVELSGIKDLLKEHYARHRHSFLISEKE